MDSKLLESANLVFAVLKTKSLCVKKIHNFFVSEDRFKHAQHCHPELPFSYQDVRLPMGAGHFGILRNHPVNDGSLSAQRSSNHMSAYQPMDYTMLDNDHNLPYRCSICNKGYRSHFGLYHHKQHVHEKKSFPCPICESRFTQKGKVKRHLNTVHKVAVCLNCSSILKLGADYNQHVLYCCK